MSPTIPGKRLAGLDHLRALAIILVFIYHYRLFGHPPLVESLGSFGWTGVDLFFVLSGYLIGGQLLGAIARRQPLSPGAFYMRRAFRIIPAYLAVLILYFTIPAFTERSHLPPLWRFLTFTQNFGLDLRANGAFSHAWSLCIEEQFYLILPLILLALVRTDTFRRSGWILAGLSLAGIGLRYFNWEHFVAPQLDADGAMAYYKYIYYPTYDRLDGLLAGLALAAASWIRPALFKRLTGLGNFLLLGGIAVLVAVWFVCEDFISFGAALFGYPLIALGYGMFTLAALSPSCWLYRYGSRITRFIATISYSLYLTHKQLIHLTQLFFTRHGLDPDSYTLFWISAAFALLGGWILHIAVEWPFLRLRDRLLTSKPLHRTGNTAHPPPRHPASLQAPVPSTGSTPHPSSERND